MGEHETMKAYELGDDTVRRVLSDVFSAEYRHGYYLRDVVRAPRHGGWLCIWVRTLESYDKAFDWSATAEANNSGQTAQEG